MKAGEAQCSSFLEALYNVRAYSLPKTRSPHPFNQSSTHYLLLEVAWNLGFSPA